jgi:hypothetical protein
MPALTAELVPGEVLRAALRAQLNKFCPALPAKLSCLSVSRLAFGAFHLSPAIEICFPAKVEQKLNE